MMAGGGNFADPERTHYMLTYSPFFATLHDEVRPTGQLGRGTHCSILRAVGWHDLLGQLVDEAMWTDFGVVWDEDHDTRVIDVVTVMHQRGLLGRALFVGERKGDFTVVVSDDFYTLVRGPQGVEEYEFVGGAEGIEAYRKEVEQITQALSDPWPTHVERIGTPSGYLINDKPERVAMYLNTLNMLWALGPKVITPRG